MARLPRLRFALAALCLLPALLAAQEEWRFRREDALAALAANPLAGAQRAAFFAARGFVAEGIAPYAAACGFSFSFRNLGEAPLRLRLDEWAAVQGEARYRLRLPAEWDARWRQAGVAEAARIAFRYAQFPPEQEFAPGDWIMGMATLDGRPAGKFRLVARYHDDKESHDIALDDLTCD